MDAVPSYIINYITLYFQLKTMIMQEKHSKTTAERNLAEGIRNIKNYDEMFKSTLGQVIDFLHKLR